MKRVLLLCSFSVAFLLGKAQIVFNEFYTDPGSGKQEFFELYNTSINPAPENLNSYTLIVYNKTGFYVLDFPDVTVGSKSFFVGASATTFNVQSKTGVSAQIDWNNLGTGGSLTYWEVDNTPGPDGDGNDHYNLGTVPANFNDLFPTQSGGGAAYAMLLFKEGNYINGFLGGYNISSVEANIKNMQLLNVPMVGTASFPINWGTILLAENTTANGGSDNGFIRERDGKCGSWKKSSASITHTPGTTNGSAANLTGGLVITEPFIACGASQPGEPNQVKFSITNVSGDATLENSFPVTVFLYLDNGTSPGILDGNDTYYAPTLTINGINEGQKIMNFYPQNQRIILVFKTILGCFDQVKLVENSCSPLPVTFSNFHAVRSKQTVALKWETASEQNNRGFNVQRNTRGAWETVAFVFSAANGGNSDQLLSYSYNDPNSEKGVSQYRIQQVDLDGKASYSTIRSVKGLEQAGARTVVYPNPSQDGKVSVVFDDQSAKAVTVSDLSGRVVRQYRNVLNNLSIEGLESGMYSIQITDLSSAVSTTEKVIIKKR